MERNTKSSALGVLVLFVSLQSCANNNVRESDRDQTGQYDGTWSVEIVETPNYQPHPNGHFMCGDRTGENWGTIAVKDGNATATEFPTKKPTFVNQNGQFQFSTSLKANPAHFRRFNTTQSGVTIILSGSLEKEAAVLTYALFEKGNHGCKSKVKISRT